jgi:hypothetical protein
VIRYNGLADGHDKALALAVEESGNAYVTGSIYVKEMGSVYGTIKYTQNISKIGKVGKEGGGDCFIDVAAHERY